MSPQTPDDDMPESHPDARAPRARGLGRLRRDRSAAASHTDDDTDAWVRMLTPTEDDDWLTRRRGADTDDDAASIGRTGTDITNTASGMRRDRPAAPAAEHDEWPGSSRASRFDRGDITGTQADDRGPGGTGQLPRAVPPRWPDHGRHRDAETESPNGARSLLR